MTANTLFGLNQQTIQKINTVFEQQNEIVEVLIYGSRAKGTNKKSSDIDFTIKGTGISISILNNISENLDNLFLPYTFDLSIYEHIKNDDLLNHITRNGKVFYSKK